MRLLIALMNPSSAQDVQCELERRGHNAEVVTNGARLPRLLWERPCDVLLLHECLPGMDGLAVLAALQEDCPICPPRVLFVCEPELCVARPTAADCIAPICAEPQKLCDLAEIIGKKPLPKLAAARNAQTAQAIERFLDALSLPKRLKGRAYAAWLLRLLVPSPMLEELPLCQLYHTCADAFHTTPASVERALRVAVESVFTQGSMQGIERFFGATVDPERGKPTNRAFLIQAAQQLRHSLTTACSVNSSEMHHSPAAPTMV
ncbi:MAG: hypothetical protein MR842_02980 [Clostridiales bacterium]|nr:hypothetical protein [Clostridiales bacterium]MDO4349471.1 sporulation initiation factor Spo0A C-terminal domain-containing protein [Eubacteriales bacterium]MDY4009414.1 sporulation initiation factor Spo0A C-terminal domain-containing protein [Candidatus Limiplasma sp.]